MLIQVQQFIQYWLGGDMSSIVVAGDTSGSVTLSAPAVAGSTVLTLPSVSGTLPIVSGDLGTPSALVGTNISGTSNSLNAGIGVNQTWTDVKTTPGRVSGTTYTNSTGKPIAVVVMCNSGSSTVGLTITVGGVAFGGSVNYAGTAAYTARDFFIVPNGVTYVVTSNGTITNWLELR
jgi:hypothetical protein